MVKEERQADLTLNLLGADGSVDVNYWSKMRDANDVMLEETQAKRD